MRNQEISGASVKCLGYDYDCCMYVCMYVCQIITSAKAVVFLPGYLLVGLSVSGFYQQFLDEFL